MKYFIKKLNEEYSFIKNKYINENLSEMKPCDLSCDKCDMKTNFCDEIKTFMKPDCLVL